MSGRLVILPHKSWNVWNQDNREKVARDERLHREAEEAKAQKEKELLQEHNIEHLRSNTGDNSVNDITQDNDFSLIESKNNETDKPFRLFEDLEQQHFSRIGQNNEEYMQEQALKEQLKRKREGIDNWALGDGSRELAKSKAWYESSIHPIHSSHPRPTSISTSTSSSDAKRTITSTVNGDANQQYHREILRKERADPMGKYLHKTTNVSGVSDERSTGEVHVFIKSEPQPVLNNHMDREDVGALSVAEEEVHVRSREDADEAALKWKKKTGSEQKKRKKQKKEKKDKEKDKRQKTAGSTRDRGNKRHAAEEEEESVSEVKMRGKTIASNVSSSTSSSSSSSARGTDHNSKVQAPINDGTGHTGHTTCSISGTTNDCLWADLRVKRLTREAAERKKASVLLATRDIFGDSRGAGFTPKGAGAGALDPAAIGGGGSYSYGQQYHPHLARNNRYSRP